MMRSTFLCLALFITVCHGQGDSDSELSGSQRWPSAGPSADYMDSPQNASINPFGLLLLSQKVQLGSVADFSQQAMVDTCNGAMDPAIEFYGCVENRTQISPLWAAMKLNATYLKIRTTQAIHINSENATSAMDTLWTVFNRDDQNLTDITTAIAQNIPLMCSDAQQLTQCMNPFVSSCFPSNASRSANDQTSSTAQNSSDYNMAYNSEFFGLPLLDDQQQIINFVQSMISSACDNEAFQMKTILSNTNCIIESISNITDNCQNLFTFSTPSNTTSTDNSSLEADMSSPRAMTKPQKCSKMFRDIQCISRQLNNQCHDPALLNILNVWGNTYFMAVGCPMVLSTQ